MERRGNYCVQHRAPLAARTGEGKWNGGSRIWSVVYTVCVCTQAAEAHGRSPCVEGGKVVLCSVSHGVGGFRGRAEEEKQQQKQLHILHFFKKKTVFLLLNEQGRPGSSFPTLFLLTVASFPCPPRPWCECPLLRLETIHITAHKERGIKTFVLMLLILKRNRQHHFHRFPPFPISRPPAIDMCTCAIFCFASVCTEFE